MFFFRLVVCLTVLSFFSGAVIPPGYAQLAMSQSGTGTPPTVFNLPAPGMMVNPSPGYVPAVLKGVKVYTDNPFKLDFIVDTGDSGLKDDHLKAEAAKLIKYFLASLTVPEKDLWVNLSPYESDRIIPEGFGVTEMGRDLLAQDYILKQLTASLIYPENDLGKQFWDRVNEKIREKYGSGSDTSDGTSEGRSPDRALASVGINTFNKVWIVPDVAGVYENQDMAFVVDSRLKVMMEEDYVASSVERGADRIETTLATGQDLNAKRYPLSAEILRELILPEIEREVNEGQNFALLRQIYHSLILATWFKDKLKQSFLGKTYVEQNKVLGVDIDDHQAKEKIYQQYLAAFKKGVYDYIKEDYVAMEAQQDDTATSRAPARDERDIQYKMIPRKYFSGGANFVGTVKRQPRSARAAGASVSKKGDLAMVSASLGEVRDGNSVHPSRQDITIAASGTDEDHIVDNNRVTADGRVLLGVYSQIADDSHPDDFAMVSEIPYTPVRTFIISDRLHSLFSLLQENFVPEGLFIPGPDEKFERSTRSIQYAEVHLRVLAKMQVDGAQRLLDVLSEGDVVLIPHSLVLKNRDEFLSTLVHEYSHARINKDKPNRPDFWTAIFDAMLNSTHPTVSLMREVLTDEDDFEFVEREDLAEDILLYLFDLIKDEREYFSTLDAILNVQQSRVIKSYHKEIKAEVSRMDLEEISRLAKEIESEERIYSGRITLVLNALERYKAEHPLEDRGDPAMAGKDKGNLSPQAMEEILNRKAREDPEIDFLRIFLEGARGKRSLGEELTLLRSQRILEIGPDKNMTVQSFFINDLGFDPRNIYAIGANLTYDAENPQFVEGRYVSGWIESPPVLWKREQFERIFARHVFVNVKSAIDVRQASQSVDQILAVGGTFAVNAITEAEVDILKRRFGFAIDYTPAHDGTYVFKKFAPKPRKPVNDVGDSDPAMAAKPSDGEVVKSSEDGGGGDVRASSSVRRASSIGEARTANGERRDSDPAMAATMNGSNLIRSVPRGTESTYVVADQLFSLVPNQEYSEVIGVAIPSFSIFNGTLVGKLALARTHLAAEMDIPGAHQLLKVLQRGNTVLLKASNIIDERNKGDGKRDPRSPYWDRTWQEELMSNWLAEIIHLLLARLQESQPFLWQSIVEKVSETEHPEISRIRDIFKELEYYSDTPEQITDEVLESLLSFFRDKDEIYSILDQVFTGDQSEVMKRLYEEAYRSISLEDVPILVQIAEQVSPYVESETAFVDEIRTFLGEIISGEIVSETVSDEELEDAWEAFNRAIKDGDDDDPAMAAERESQSPFNSQVLAAELSRQMDRYAISMQPPALEVSEEIVDEAFEAVGLLTDQPWTLESRPKLEIKNAFIYDLTTKLMQETDLGRLPVWRRAMDRLAEIIDSRIMEEDNGKILRSRRTAREFADRTWGYIEDVRENPNDIESRIRVGKSIQQLILAQDDTLWRRQNSHEEPEAVRLIRAVAALCSDPEVQRNFAQETIYKYLLFPSIKKIFHSLNLPRLYLFSQEIWRAAPSFGLMTLEEIAQHLHGYFVARYSHKLVDVFYLHQQLQIAREVFNEQGETFQGWLSGQLRGEATDEAAQDRIFSIVTGLVPLAPDIASEYFYHIDILRTMVAILENRYSADDTTSSFDSLLEISNVLRFISQSRQPPTGEVQVLHKQITDLAGRHDMRIENMRDDPVHSIFPTEGYRFMMVVHNWLRVAGADRGFDPKYRAITDYLVEQNFTSEKTISSEGVNLGEVVRVISDSAPRYRSLMLFINQKEGLTGIDGAAEGSFSDPQTLKVKYFLVDEPHSETSFSLEERFHWAGGDMQELLGKSQEALRLILLSDFQFQEERQLDEAGDSAMSAELSDDNSARPRHPSDGGAAKLSRDDLAGSRGTDDGGAEGNRTSSGVRRISSDRGVRTEDDGRPQDDSAILAYQIQREQEVLAKLGEKKFIKLTKVLSGEIPPDRMKGRISYIRLDSHQRPELKGKVLAIKGFTDRIFQILNGEERVVRHSGKGRIIIDHLVDERGRSYDVVALAGDAEGMMSFSSVEREHHFYAMLNEAGVGFTATPVGTVKFNNRELRFRNEPQGAALMIIDDEEDIRLNEELELLAGAEIKDGEFIEEGAREFAAEIKDAIFQSVRAMREMHRLGIIHRFFHFGNIAFNNGELQIRNFNSAKDAREMTPLQFQTWVGVDFRYFYGKLEELESMFQQRGNDVAPVLGKNWLRDLFHAYLGENFEEWERVNPDVNLRSAWREMWKLINAQTSEFSQGISHGSGVALQIPKRSPFLSEVFERERMSIQVPDPVISLPLTKEVEEFGRVMATLRKDATVKRWFEELIERGDYKAAVSFFERNQSGFLGGHPYPGIIYNYIVALLVTKQDAKARRIYFQNLGKIKDVEQLLLKRYKQLTDIDGAEFTTPIDIPEEADAALTANPTRSNDTSERRRGGIDLNANLNVRTRGQGVEFNVPQAEEALPNAQFDGLKILDLQIRYFTPQQLPVFLGVANDKEEFERLSRLP